MKVETIRFGTIEVPEERVLTFPEGLPGFASKRFTLIFRDEHPPLGWLQSLDEPELSLMTLDPKDLPLEYKPTPKPAEVRAVVPNEAQNEDVALRVIVRAGEQPGTLYFNLFAPLLFNAARRLGMQVPLVGSGFSVREPWPPTGEPPAKPAQSHDDPDEQGS